MSLLTLPYLGIEQANLPGLEGQGIPAGTEPQPAPDAGEPAGGPCTGQLTFGVQQPGLTEAAPQPRQLPLFADPPLWEIPPPPKASAKRLPRSRQGRNRRLSKGQISLF